jgi:hypothetical protein
MPIMQTRSRADRRSRGTVPANSFHHSVPAVFLFKQPAQPAVPIHNELPLLVCLFKRKKGRDAS